MRIRIIILSLLLSFTLSAQIPFGFWGGSTTAALTSLFANHNSLELDGVNQYVTVPADSSLSFGNGTTDSPFTVSAWIYPATTTGGVQMISGKGGTNFEFLAVVNNNDFELRLYDLTGGNRTYAVSQNTLTNANTWQHLTWTYDGSGLNTGITIYRNGIDITTGVGSVGSYTAMHTTAEPFTIGAYGAGLSPFDGKIDQAVVWNKELSVSEIKEITALRDLTKHSAYANIVSWWEFDDADVSGTTVDDRVGANDATMVNSPTRPQCITYPYSYQLYASATYDSLTLMQSADASAFGGVAIDLDGSTEYLTTPDNALLSRGDGSTDNPLSFYAVVNADDFTNFQICEKSGEYAFWVNASDQLEVRFTDASSGGYIGRLYSTPITGWEGQTVVLMATKTGTTAAGIDLYFNGLVVDDVDATSGAYTAMEDGAGAFRMGYNGTTYSNGRIGYVGFLDVEATAAQALTLYNEHGDIDLRDTDVSGDLIVYYNGYNSTSATATDLSANGLNSTFTNGDVADIQYNPVRQIFEADSSGSFTFDGVNQYATVADAADLSFGDGVSDSPFSMSFWLKADSWTQARIISKGTGEYTVGGSTASLFRFQLYSLGSPSNYLRATFPVMTNYVDTWIHVTVTYDGSGGMTGYIDGVDVSLAVTTIGSYVAMSNTASAVDIGRYPSSLYYDGNLDQVVVWNKALSLSEIQELYNDGSPVDPRLTTMSANIVSAWRLNQGDSPTATDGILDIVGSNPATGVNTPTISTTSYPTN